MSDPQDAPKSPEPKAKPRKKRVWRDKDGFPELMAGDWWDDAMGANLRRSDTAAK